MMLIKLNNITAKHIDIKGLKKELYVQRYELYSISIVEKTKLKSKCPNYT